MKNHFKFSLTTIFLLLLTFLLLFSSPVFAKKHRHQKFDQNPVVFVHGGSGSASQFESQAMRFMSNGYPKDHLYAFEYDTSNGLAFLEGVPAEVLAGLDALIDEVLAITGKDQVDLMGHSLGTVVSQTYLTSEEYGADKVARWINLDGFPEFILPEDLPAMGLWANWDRYGALRTPENLVGLEGAVNILMENQTHVQVATSAESFAHMYEFFTGKAPRTTMVVPERRKAIEIAGRACIFPQNIGADGAVVEVYKVSSFSGKRLHRKPRAVFNIGEDGSFGPFKARAGERFEFVIVREGQDHHFYKEPFVRSDYFVRLQTSFVGGGLGAYVDTRPEQVNLIISRDKEFWGEDPLQNDIVAVNGVNIVNAANCPLVHRTTAIYAFDQNPTGYPSIFTGVPPDGVSQLHTPLLPFHDQFFLTGVDLFIPAEDPPKNRVRIALTPRGGNGLMQVINIPNWPSDYHRVSILFNDFVQWDNVP